ncbi:MAG: hypothetical protein K940chlam5_00022 [Candidatus Anoxychlamydiales bacterium]|nr:hypothetical protein [Candidatus Anoxychlamydiales bacterium]
MSASSSTEKTDQSLKEGFAAGVFSAWGAQAAGEFVKDRIFGPVKKTSIAFAENFRRGDAISLERKQEFQFYMESQKEQENYFRLKREVTKLALEQKIDPFMLIRVMEKQQELSYLSGRECTILSQVKKSINEEKK